MKKLVKSIFAFSSLMFLTACDSPYPIKYLYVDVDLLDGNKSQTVKVPVDSTFKELIGDYNKRGCTLTHFEDQKGNKFSLEDKIELTEDQFYKAVYTVDQDEIMETNDEMLNKHGDLRIMSFNVLSDDWNNKPKMHGYDAHNDKYPDGVDDGSV